MENMMFFRAISRAIQFVVAWAILLGFIWLVVQGVKTFPVLGTIWVVIMTIAVIANLKPKEK